MPVEKSINQNYLEKIVQWILHCYYEPQIRVKSEINDNQQTRTTDKQAQKKKQWTNQLLIKKMY